MGDRDISIGSMLAVPDRSAMAQFAPDFGQRVLLTVDTEEEFDWESPLRREGHGLAHVPQIARFQTFCEKLGVSPVYLVDWPIASDPGAVEIIGDAVRRGTAEVGIQLHPWVNPPFEEEVTNHNSYAGRLPKELEAAKFTALLDLIEKAFGTKPMIYRAGRYGLGPDTGDLLKKSGVPVDTSVRARFDYTDEGGRDYSHHPIEPYWLDDARTMLEMPLTTVYWGVLRQLGTAFQRIQRFVPTLYSAFSRFRLLERIALTPEGVTAKEALRGIDIALDTGAPLLVLSFHSPTLAAGMTPYARSTQDVEAVYDWFETVFAYLEKRGVAPTTVAQVLASAR